MAKQETQSLALARGTAAAGTGAAGIGRASVQGAYATLMQLTSDAVCIFDATLRILACNERAESLCGVSREQLVGSSITSLLIDPRRDRTTTPQKPSELPFALDGSMTVLALRLASGGAEQVVVRADRVSAPGETYLLTFKPFDVPTELELEHDRLVDELALANRRLSGTLKIVLDTIDVADVETLFSEVLQQISETLDASGAVLFLAETRGYRLHAATVSLQNRRLPQFMSYSEGLATIVARTGTTMRLRLTSPTEKSLRAGALATRELVDEETGKSYRVPARQVPPFLSVLCVPVWFAGRVIAIIEAGWDDSRPIRKDDARLLDTVAQYLSVEFAAAISTMRTERIQHLDALANQLHDTLEGDVAAMPQNLTALVQTLVDSLDVVVAPVRVGSHGEPSLVMLPAKGETSVPVDAPFVAAAGPDTARSAADMPDTAPAAVPAASVTAPSAATGSTTPSTAPGVVPDAPAVTSSTSTSTSASSVSAPPAGLLDGLELPFALDPYLKGKRDQNIAVVPIPHASKLAQWLAQHDASSNGVIFDLGAVLGVRRVALLLRPANQEPIDDAELDFLRRVAIDVNTVAQEREQRSKDTHISQALQSGMRNDLQQVDGITAKGLYSSATAAALVGGDFYDLIALPNRRACVILGDVSGKGVEAASVSAAVKTALGAYAWEGQTPARMVRLLNDFLLGFSRLETFATLFVGMIDLAHGTLTYCSAGHPPAIFLHSDTHEIQTLDEQSGVVGAFKGMTYHDGHVNIKTGDGLLLYTDGVTEARNPEGAFFGETGLQETVMAEGKHGVEELPARILGRLDEFTERSLEDDVAMVSLRFDEVGPRKK